MKSNEKKYTYKVGEIISGTILKHTAQGVIVNIGSMEIGFVPLDNLAMKYKLGQSILLLNTGKLDNYGNLILDNVLANKLAVDNSEINKIKVGSKISVVLNSKNKIGYNGIYKKMNIFLPNSLAEKELELSKEIELIVVQVNNYKNTIVCSANLV